MLFPTKFQLNDITVKDLNAKIAERQYFAFAKVLHGYWERLYHITQQHSLSNIKKTLADICKNNPEFYNSTVDLIPQDKEGTRSLFGVLRRDIDWHYYELIDFLRNRSDVIWGVHPEGFPTDCHQINPLRRECVEIMEVILNPNNTYYDGRLWKTACLDGTILDFLNEIRNKKICVVGLNHLANINDNKYWKFEKFDFIQVQMPLSPKRNEFVKLIINHKKQQSDDIAYLFQLGMLAPWAVCKIWDETKDCWILDMGKSLDLFVEESKRPYLPFAQNIAWS